MNMLPRLTEALTRRPDGGADAGDGGSACTMASAFCCRSYIAWNETSVEASVPPQTRPVSSCGKKPLGVRT
jgi:hypothetical protein